jgi:hypothetical protein
MKKSRLQRVREEEFMAELAHWERGNRRTEYDLAVCVSCGKPRHEHDLFDNNIVELDGTVTCPGFKKEI